MENWKENQSTSTWCFANRPDEILAVHEALDALALIDSQSAEVVKLHYFGGFSLDKIADVVRDTLAS